MRSISSLAGLFLSALTPNALAQAEATFPLPEDTAEVAAEEAPEDAASEVQQTADDPAAPAETPAPATDPQGPPPRVDDPNPYGAPPAPPPPLPGNPYGTVPHRPPTPAPNPYVGAPRNDATTASSETIEQTNWSVGGGLLAETSSGLRYEGYGAINQGRLRPSLLFERRLTAALHVLLQPSLFYQKSRLETSSTAGSSGDEGSLEELSLRLEGGLRWVANPGGPVELGMSHVLSLTNYQAISEGGPNLYFPGLGNAELNEWTIGLSNSFLAERRLIPHLWLRMAVGLVGIHHRTQKIITYTESEDEETGETVESEDESTSTGFHVGLTPSLALQLRITF